jgi:hypothetical protein
MINSKSRDHVCEVSFELASIISCDNRRGTVSIYPMVIEGTSYSYGLLVIYRDPFCNFGEIVNHDDNDT